MSTILKALRRLEREKAGPGRPLREQVTGPGNASRGDGRPPRRWPILLGGVGAGVLAGLAVLFLVLSRGDSVEEVAPEAAAQTAAPPTPQPPRGERRVRPAPRARAPAQPRAAARAVKPLVPEPDLLEDVVVVDRGTPQPRIVDEPEPAPSAEAAAPKPGSLRPMHRPDPRALPGRHLIPEAADVPAVVPEVAASVQAPAPATSPEPAPLPEPAPRVERPPTPVEAPRVEPAPAPRAATPPREATKTASAAPAPFPDLRVERTTWHPVAERRVAVIELPGGGTQSVHEGDRVAGAVVKRIEPSGVVFEQAGREVRRKIGEPGGRALKANLWTAVHGPRTWPGVHKFAFKNVP